ncbi:MAG: 2-phospho-L-lactate guanylyltransferase [Candidatus Acidiferrales bacterium]
MILVPVKNLGNAKQRLSAVLDAAERTALARAMLEDVLTTLGEWRARPPVAVVARDPFALALARKFNFEIMDDPDGCGETEAIERASRICAARGFTTTLVLPGDIPLLQAREVEEVLAAAPPEGAVLAPSYDGRGTNAVLRRPAELFPLTFGGDSFERHLARARATGKPCEVRRLPGIALDVDTPEDLAVLLAAETASRAQALLHEWGVGDPAQRESA